MKQPIYDNETGTFRGYIELSDEIGQKAQELEKLMRCHHLIQICGLKLAESPDRQVISASLSEAQYAEMKILRDQIIDRKDSRYDAQFIKLISILLDQ